MSPPLRTWLAEPVEPSIFGDGRSIADGAWSTSLRWPPPSTVAGAVRFRHGRDPHGRFDPRRLAEVLALRSYGPHLVSIDETGGVEWLFPAPADCREDASGQAHRCLPLQLAAGESVADGLVPVATDKPVEGAPLWRAAGLLGWLVDGRVDLAAVAHAAPPAEVRIHVSMLPEAEVARDGALFATVGRSFWFQERSTSGGGPVHRLALAVRTDAEVGEGPGPLGGEQRMARWRPDPLAFPSLPTEVLESAAAGFVRLVLTTPAWFAQGSRPGPDTFGRIDGQPVELIAAADGRAQVVSGWNYQRNLPKPTRRLVPEGAVFFLRLPGSPAARRAWAQATWGAPMSDPRPADARSDDPFNPRLDGFGVAVLGTWSGERAALHL